MKDVLEEISAKILTVFHWCRDQTECEYMTQFIMWSNTWIIPSGDLDLQVTWLVVLWKQKSKV